MRSITKGSLAAAHLLENEMKQFVYYITTEPFNAYWFLHIDDVCNLPGVGYHKVKDSPYRLTMQQS